MHKLTGGCYCGNIVVSVELTAAPDTYHPRTCDCDFCRKHGAAYVSDPNGSLTIQINSPAAGCTYRQGSEQAEMLLCRTCGVLIGAVYRSTERLYATVNMNALAGAARFGPGQSVSPRKLSAEDRVKRWQELWFSKVDLRSK